MAWMPRNVVLYSVGLLGASFGLALKNSGFKGSITGLSSLENLNTALGIGCIDKGYSYDSLEECLTDADLLVLCSPIQSIIDTLANLRNIKLPQNLLISDIGSTKRLIVDEAIKLPDHVHFIGGHPMAGSEKSGPSSADPYLFQNAIYVLTPPTGEINQKEKDFAAFLEKYLGCTTLFLTPSIHDRIAATVSHIPHLLAVALVNLAGQTEQSTPDTFTLAAGGFRDMTRIASSSYPMWHDILTTNKSAINPLFDSLLEILLDMKEKLQNDDLKSCFQTASQTRARIPNTNKGFIRPLSEILVLAKDQPGFIASITSLLANQNINIKDIEVLKVREGEGGTIRLAFETQSIANEAVSVLSANGFYARERM